MNIKKIIPILEWLPNYKAFRFKGDLVAGITVGIILIPQGIAYALIAGLPPIYGLYCALLPQIIYAIFGSSRQVAIGPVAMDSLIVASGVSTLAVAGSDSYISIAILLALMVGTLQFIMGVFRLGFLVNFISKPVINGFTSAVAITIGMNQFRNLLGVDFIQSDQIQFLIKDIWYYILDFNLHTTIIGLISILIIIIFRRINKQIPNALIVVIIGVLTMRFFGDSLNGVSIVKEIPSGLPSFSTPDFDFQLIKNLMPIALTLVMVGYLETITIGKSLEVKQDEYRVRPSQELIALGLSNIVGSFFKAYPSSSSFSRSAINQETGGTTGMSALISAAIVGVTLLFLTPLFYFLPKTVLAAVIIVAVFGLVNLKQATSLWKINKLDFSLMLATFIFTLLLGIEYGILAGISLSLAILIYRISRPYVTELGNVPNSDFYRNKNRFKEVIVEEDVLIFRFEAQLVYANATYFRDYLEQMVDDKGTLLKLIVLDSESINRIDTTGVEMLKELVRYFQNKQILFYFAGVKGPVRDLLFRAGLLENIDITHFFMCVNDAVVFYKTGDRSKQEKFSKYLHQSCD
tara:strand:- start:2029 stop:3756 length:1728 start_codon:yes stop_codon:yes gene_type:complete